MSQSRRCRRPRTTARTAAGSSTASSRTRATASASSPPRARTSQTASRQFAVRDLAFATATEQAELVRQGDLSPAELFDTYLERIGRLDPELNAFVTLCEPTEPRDGPFRGVPLPIKDLTETEGVRTTYSSRAFADYVPDFDPAVVRRLKDAGFVLLGKTNTCELGITVVTESELNGVCRNPWDLSRTSGGSSGGAAVAVATGMAPLAHGSDGGGSIRIPASCCGVFGLKPAR